jgi:hypothetical protein
MPIKTTIAAFFMLICGSLFLIFGTYVYVADVRTGSDRGLAMLALGILSKYIYYICVSIYIIYAFVYIYI